MQLNKKMIYHDFDLYLYVKNNMKINYYCKK